MRKLKLTDYKECKYIKKVTQMAEVQKLKAYSISF